MKIYTYPDKEDWKNIMKRPLADFAEVNEKARRILNKVRQKGDKAVRQYTEKLDGIRIKKFQVSENEIKEAGSFLSPELKEAIAVAKQNIETFHAAQQQPLNQVETIPGVNCWRRQVGIEKIGLYIPGGSAPLFSTVLMLAIPATLAGCKEIILCSPPDKKGNIHPAIIYAADLCGITKIFKIGGAQAIGAMAYGTETVPGVFKIFGPGNQYVTAAKTLVQLDGVAIDMPAGPSELLIIADETSNPEFIAADLLSQAEHGPDSQVILVTNSQEVMRTINDIIEQQLENLPRKELATKALKHSKLILLKNLKEAVEFSDQYAPEHLIIMCAGARTVSEKIISAGSVFIGSYSPESAGDYATGTNHTLPTNGFAAMYSGVSFESFTKTISFQELTQEGLQNIGETVMTMAEAEGLWGHKNAVAIRLKK